MPITKFSVRIVGMEELIEKLKAENLYAEPWTQAMDALGRVGEQFAIRAAPMFRGTTIARMTYRVDKRPVPLYAVVKTTARNPKNHYGYARLQEYWSRSPHFGWMVEAIKSSRSVWEPILEDCARKIERRWGS